MEGWLEAPLNRKAFSNVPQILKTARIKAGKTVSDLNRNFRDISNLPCLTITQEEVWTIDRFLAETYTDGFMVLRGGEVIYERYFGHMDASTQHIAMSVSKSFCGMLAGCLVADGRLDLDAATQSYVPELASTPYGSATVQHLLDMAVSLNFSMEYANPVSEVQTEDRCAGWRAARPGDPANSRSFLSRLTGENGNGQVFQYCSATTDVLSWVLERAAKTPFAQLGSELIWSRLGAEANAFITIDSAATPYACAGMGMTLADLMRFGRLVRDGGVHLGQQIIPKSWIDDTRKGGHLAIPDHRHFGLQERTGSYRNQWWITDDDHGSFYAIGINGQYLWIDPVEDVVIAKFSSEPAAEARGDEHSQAFRAIASIVGSISQ